MKAYTDSTSNYVFSNNEKNKNTELLERISYSPKIHLLKRIWKHPILMHYHRLFVTVLIINILLIVNSIETFSVQSIGQLKQKEISNFVLINLFVATLIRQQYVINGLFWVATKAPKSWPLSIRAIFGKIYHFGGLHSGCAIAATIWFAIFSINIFQNYISQQDTTPDALMLITLSLLSILFTLIIMAIPGIRSRYHNLFEKVHRFGGWSALILFWCLTILLVAQQSPENKVFSTLIQTVDFWVLSLVTLSIILPWLRLKKVPINTLKPSSHVAVTEFNYGVTPFAGSSTALSRNPLMEWHSFANVPSPHKNGFRLVISRAGDWTGNFIDDTPSHIWVKGIPTAGVGNIELLFRRVIWVATGSGVGPCIPHLLSKKIPSKLVWITRNPRKTYGDQLTDEILEAQPDAFIWDTEKDGKPDIAKIAYQACREFNAEAVICISNKKLTWQVVYGMESRGIPAYGAIWDS